MRTGQIDLEALRRDRDQLWAEAAHLEAQGASIALPQELWADARQEQDLRVEDDSWLDILRGVRGEQYAGELRVSSSHILSETLNVPEEHQLPHMTKRVAGLMRKLGWQGPKPLRFANGQTLRGYCRPVGGSEEEEPI